MNKNILYYLIIVLAAFSCQSATEKNESSEKDKNPESEIEVKKFYSEGKLAKEVSFKNGIRHGICKNYYDDGRLKRTIWYENGLKEDTAKWFYTEGMVYRATPYRNDKIHGVQTKYYKDGKIQAALPYRNGLRLQGLKEYFPYGSPVESYPDIEYNIRDLTGSDAGVVKIMTSLSNESVNVRYYRGSLIDGCFDPDKVKDITVSSGRGYLQLSKDDEKGKEYVDIIAVYVTRFRNKKIITKRIDLPYNNLY